MRKIKKIPPSKKPDIENVVSPVDRNSKQLPAYLAGDLSHLPSHVFERFVRKPEVKDRFALSDSSLYQKIADNLFPKPYHPYGARVSVWLQSELDVHMAAQLKAIGKEVNA